MKYFSTFSGIGGFELGIKKAYVDTTTRGQNRKSKSDPQKNAKTGQGLLASESKAARATKGSAGQYDKHRSERGEPDCVGFSEIDKYATEIYQKHFPSHKNYGDITKIKSDELPDFDIFVGGFPCQAFSIAGKRHGFDDTRGTLFFEIARILGAKRPRLCLLENVKGLLSHDSGKTFEVILATLDELGYDCQWQVLNSKNFGVPQNRERVYIVGHLRGESRPEVFPLAESDYISHGQLKVIRNSRYDTDRLYDPSGLARTMRANAGGKGAKTGLYKVAKTIRIGGRGSPHGSKQNWDSYEIDGQIRRLTPTECERLQGFPDGWTAGLSDAQRYKTLGNAVTVNVVEAIMKKIYAIH